MNLISGRSMAREHKALGSRSVRRGLLGTTLIEVLVTIVVFLVGILPRTSIRSPRAELALLVRPWVRLGIGSKFRDPTCSEES